MVSEPALHRLDLAAAQVGAFPAPGAHDGPGRKQIVLHKKRRINWGLGSNGTETAVNP